MHEDDEQRWPDASRRPGVAGPRPPPAISPVRVGGDVRSLCRRCGETWHVVIAVHQGRIAKVECGDCKAGHRYRPPGGAAPGAPGPRPVRAAGAAPRSARMRAEPVVEPDLSRPPRPFAPSETYRVGDRLLHPQFGEGVVQALAGPRKIRVLFQAGPKALVHDRGGG